MAFLNLDTTTKIGFLKLSFDNNFKALSEVVSIFFSNRTLDLSFGDVINFRNSDADISTLISASKALIEEIRTFDEDLSDVFSQRLESVIYLLESIRSLNDNLVQIESLIQTGKKYYDQLFDVYSVVISLFESGYREYPVQILRNLSEFLLNLGENPHFHGETDFKFKVFELQYTLFGITLGRIYAIDELNSEFIESWLLEIENLSSEISIEAKFVLNSFLKIITGKLIDSTPEYKSDLKLSEYYWQLAVSTRNDGEVIKVRDIFERGILKIKLAVEENGVLALEYTYFKKLYQDILSLMDVDIDLLIEEKDELINYLLFAKGKFESDGSNSQRNLKRIRYINEILELINGI